MTNEPGLEFDIGEFSEVESNTELQNVELLCNVTPDVTIDLHNMKVTMSISALGKLQDRIERCRVGEIKGLAELISMYDESGADVINHRTVKPLIEAGRTCLKLRGE